MIIISALKLELDFNALPASSLDLALSLTVWKSDLDSLNHISEFLCNHSEKKDDSLFVDWLVTQTTEINWIAVCRTIFEF